MSFVLAAKPRTVVGSKVKTLLAQRQIPAVVYGTGVKNQNIQVDVSTFRKLYSQAGENQVVDLTVEGQKMHHVLIREVQIQPVRRDIIHIDFYAIDITKPVEVQIPLVYVGEAPAVKIGGNTLVKKMAYINIRCLPKDFAKSIDVSIAGLENIGNSITVKDLKVPASWTILETPEEIVATVIAPRIETFDVKPGDAEAAAIAAVNAVPEGEKKEGEAAAGDKKAGDKKAGAAKADEKKPADKKAEAKK